MKKDEAIKNTFKGIAKNFSKVFSELVPGGKAELVILRGRENGEEDLKSEDEQDEENDTADDSEGIQFSGIEFKVAFPSTREVTSMTQLSGGQQTVVALSLIFAIQKCDPSPFYLFDEIDSNLDAVYRTAVASEFV
jgi:structural maintenance of chromosome 3 (chondroitin sulfate proteoglycan 6)